MHEGRSSSRFNDTEHSDVNGQFLNHLRRYRDGKAHDGRVGLSQRISCSRTLLCKIAARVWSTSSWLRMHVVSASWHKRCERSKTVTESEGVKEFTAPSLSAQMRAGHRCGALRKAETSLHE